jgi:DNA (cytosine-5)-methyltransferase 1
VGNGNSITFGSLFAGIGGLDLGLERAGMECRWQVEWDDYCQKVLAKHWPDIRRYGDVKKTHGKAYCPKVLADTKGRRQPGRTEQECDPQETDPGRGCNAIKPSQMGRGRNGNCPNCLEPVDLICGGFPCQPVSVAGKRKGDQDERWLWPQFLRIIRELRPRWVLVENVPGLLSTDNGRLMGGILRDLAQSGYDAEWDCIPAAAVGAPHLRYRVFIVAYAQGEQGGGLFQFGLWPNTRASGQDVANTQVGRLAEREAAEAVQHDAECRGIFEGRLNSRHEGWWAVEPQLGRVAHGVPHRVHRLKALGNAVVPQVAEWIGRTILEAEGK